MLLHNNLLVIIIVDVVTILNLMHGILLIFANSRL